MAAGEFRDDLLYGLSDFPIHLSPLRDRRDDIPALAQHFLSQSRLAEVADLHLSDEVLDALRSRPWAGNIRELRTTIERAAIVARGRTIRPEHLPAAPAESGGLDQGAVDSIGPRLAAWARHGSEARRVHPGESDHYERFLKLTDPHLLRAVLSACQNNRARAARLLGIHRATLRQKLNRYGLQDAFARELALRRQAGGGACGAAWNAG